MQSEYEMYHSIHSMLHHSCGFKFKHVWLNRFDHRVLRVSRNRTRMAHPKVSILFLLLVPSHTPWERNRVQGRPTLPCVPCPTLLRDSDIVYNPFDNSYLATKGTRSFNPSKRRKWSGMCRLSSTYVDALREVLLTILSLLLNGVNIPCAWSIRW